MTLTGEQLVHLPYAGPDQRVKLLLPRPGQQHLQLDGATTIPQFLALADHMRPIIRTYTIRHHRPCEREVDIDFVLHEDPPHAVAGPASRWAIAAQVGDPAAIYGPAATYHPPIECRWQLIAGDDSALPAIGAIVESLAPTVPARVFVELADPRDRQHWECNGNVHLTWRYRADVPAHRSTALLDAIGRYSLPAGPGYVWLAGESSVVTALRRQLVSDRGVDRSRIAFTGYWRHSQGDDGDQPPR